MVSIIDSPFFKLLVDASNIPEDKVKFEDRFKKFVDDFKKVVESFEGNGMYKRIFLSKLLQRFSKEQVNDFFKGQ